MQEASWTLAAPFKEQSYHRSPSDSIANNYTPTARDLKLKNLHVLKSSSMTRTPPGPAGQEAGTPRIRIRICLWAQPCLLCALSVRALSAKWLCLGKCLPVCYLRVRRDKFPEARIALLKVRPGCGHFVRLLLPNSHVQLFGGNCVQRGKWRWYNSAPILVRSKNGYQQHGTEAGSVCANKHFCCAHVHKERASVILWASAPLTLLHSLLTSQPCSWSVSNLCTHKPYSMR